MPYYSMDRFKPVESIKCRKTDGSSDYIAKCDIRTYRESEPHSVRIKGFHFQHPDFPLASKDGVVEFSTDIPPKCKVKDEKLFCKADDVEKEM